MRPMRILFVLSLLLLAVRRQLQLLGTYIHMYVHECMCKLKMLCQFSHCTTILFLVSYIHMHK